MAVSIVAMLFMTVATARARAIDTQASAMATCQSGMTLYTGASTVTGNVRVEACDAVTVTAVALRKDLTMTLVSPAGVHYVAGDPETESFQSAILPTAGGTTPEGAAYLFVITNPQAGAWTLQVTAPQPVAENLHILVTANYSGSPVRSALLVGAPTWRVGSLVDFALASFNGTQRLTGLTIDATIRRLDDPNGPPYLLTFHDGQGGGARPAVVITDDGDDGGGGGPPPPPPPPGDGLYHASITLPTAGLWAVNAEIDGSIDGTAFHRSTAVEIEVITAGGSLNGQFGDRGIDQDSDGRLEGIGVSPHVITTQAGSYTVSVRLEAGNGNVMQRSVTADLGVGSSAPEVVFPAREMLDELSVNGPYTLAQVQLLRHDESGTVLQDERFDLGATAAYDINALRRSLSLTGVVDAVGVDTDGNGLYNRLDVTVGLYVATAARYNTSMILADPTGALIQWLDVENVDLAAGEQTLSFKFNGNLIGTHGVDGPYLLKDLIVTTYQTGVQGMVAANVGATGPFAASQFEGADSQPPSITVLLDPPGASSVNHELILVRPTIAVVDDHDPHPVVTFDGVWSNEGQDVTGDGHTSPDIIMNEDGTVWLRAERSGGGSGRVYHLLFRAMDHSNNEAVFDAKWVVPHDQSPYRPPPRFTSCIGAIGGTEPPLWELKWASVDSIEPVGIEFALVRPDSSREVFFSAEGLSGDSVIAAPVALEGSTVEVDRTGVVSPEDGLEFGSPPGAPQTGAQSAPQGNGADSSGSRPGLLVAKLWRLEQCQPNPFANRTDIAYEVAAPCRVVIEVFDSQGRRVRTVSDRMCSPGRYVATWDGTSGSGIKVRPGLYLYRMNAGTFRAQKKLVVVP